MDQEQGGQNRGCFVNFLRAVGDRVQTVLDVRKKKKSKNPDKQAEDWQCRMNAIKQAGTGSPIFIRPERHKMARVHHPVKPSVRPPPPRSTARSKSFGDIVGGRQDISRKSSTSEIVLNDKISKKGQRWRNRLFAQEVKVTR